MRRTPWLAVGFLLFLSCQDSLDPGTALNLRVLSGGGADTIDVWETVVVEARVLGIPASGVEILFRAVNLNGDSLDRPVVSLLSDGLGCPCRVPSVRYTTDRGGKASALIIHGPGDGDGVVVISAEGSARAESVLVTTNPGAPVGTQVYPQDRPIAVGSEYLLGARQVDRQGNTVLASVTFTPTSPVVDVSPAGIVHGNVIGRAKINIQLGARMDSAFVSVVPQATLALRDYSGFVGDSTGYAQMNLDGSDFHWLFKTDILPSSYSPSNALAPQWVPGTGNLVHLRAVAGVLHLFVGDSTGNERRLIDAPGPILGETDPEVSTDGSWVYFVGHSATGTAVWRIATSGGVPERLTPDSSYAPLYSPSVSPDGTQLAYIKGDRLYVRNLTTGDTTRLSDNQAAGSRWSPTGDWILYAASLPHAGYSGPLHLIRPDGTDDRILSSAPYFPGGSWSPDGTYVIVTEAGVGGSPELIEVSTGVRLPLVYERTWYGPAWRR